MGIKWLPIILILIVFISGCLEDGKEVKPEFYDNALKMEFEITEETQGKKILPGQIIRVVVSLKNQVENDTTNVDVYISDPYGMKVTQINCDEGSPIDHNGQPYGWQFDSIQSLDEQEIVFSLKVPTKEELAMIGRRLKPEFTLKYDYAGISMRYVPILAEGEKIGEKSSEFTQTYGPIHVDIDTDKWVREGDIMPVYVDVKDVVNSKSEIEIDKDYFRVFWVNQYFVMSTELVRCDFNAISSSSFGEGCPDNCDCYTRPENMNIILPLDVPFVCALEVKDPLAPMAMGLIGAEYEYRYEVVKTKTIEVETELFD